MSYLYAIGLRCGLVKIGVATKPYERLRLYCKTIGYPAEHFAFVPVDGPLMRSGVNAESVALASARKIGRIVCGHELFEGVTFGEAANIIRQAAKKTERRLVLKRGQRTRPVSAFRVSRDVFAAQRKAA